MNAVRILSSLIFLVCFFQAAAANGECPVNLRSFMVSDSYAEIDWNGANQAEAFTIQIRKKMPDGKSEVVLEQKTVWTSFFFRVAEPDAVYEFRLNTIQQGVHGAWTEWVKMETGL